MSDPRRTLADLGDSVIDRRRFIAYTGALAAPRRTRSSAATSRSRRRRCEATRSASGVASGDPTPERRVALDPARPEPLVNGGGMPPKDIAVQWQVATDAGFTRVVKSGTRAADPGARATRSTWTSAGSARAASTSTASSRSDESPSGARRPRPAQAQPSPRSRSRSPRARSGTRVLHAVPADGRGGPRARHPPRRLHLRVRRRFGRRAPRERPASFAKECFTLERYRLQHSLYKTDPDLQEVHRLFPWMVTWDDHEVDNDYSGIYPEFENTSQ